MLFTLARIYPQATLNSGRPKYLSVCFLTPSCALSLTLATFPCPTPHCSSHPCHWHLSPSPRGGCASSLLKDRLSPGCGHRTPSPQPCALAPAARGRRLSLPNAGCWAPGSTHHDSSPGARAPETFREQRLTPSVCPREGCSGPPAVGSAPGGGIREAPCPAGQGKCSAGVKSGRLEPGQDQPPPPQEWRGGGKTTTNTP